MLGTDGFQIQRFLPLSEEERQIDTGAAGDVEAGRTAETGSTYAHLWAFYTF